MSFGQKAIINGKIENQFNDYEYPYDILAISLTDSTFYEWNADSTGKFYATNINYGKYILNIQHTIRDNFFTDTVFVNEPIIEIKIVSPDCLSVNKKGICELCKSSEFVVKLNTDLIFDVWFKSKKAEKKYYKELDKKGYQIESNRLIWVKDSILNSKFKDPCNHWFCTKHMKIF